MGDQDRQHGVTNADLHRGVLPNPGAVRVADHIEWAQAAPLSLAVRFGPDGVTLEGVGSLRSAPIVLPLLMDR